MASVIQGSVSHAVQVATPVEKLQDNRRSEGSFSQSKANLEGNNLATALVVQTPPQQMIKDHDADGIIEGVAAAATLTKATLCQDPVDSAVETLQQTEVLREDAKDAKDAPKREFAVATLSRDIHSALTVEEQTKFIKPEVLDDEKKNLQTAKVLHEPTDAVVNVQPPTEMVQDASWDAVSIDVAQLLVNASVDASYLAVAAAVETPRFQKFRLEEIEEGDWSGVGVEKAVESVNSSMIYQAVQIEEVTPVYELRDGDGAKLQVGFILSDKGILIVVVAVSFGC